MKRKNKLKTAFAISAVAVCLCAGSASSASLKKKPEADPETTFIDKSKLPYDTHVEYDVDMGESEEEKEDARLIAYKAVTALQERDYYCMVDFLDFDVWYYAQNGVIAEHDIIMNDLQKSIEEGGVSPMWGIQDGYVYEYGEASVVNSNDVFLTEPYQTVLLTPKVYGSFKISKTYKVEIYETAPDGTVKKKDMYVININGTWKLDIAFNIDKTYHDMMLYYAANKA